MDTLEKFCTLFNDDSEKARELMLKYNKSFSELGVSTIIEKVKSTIDNAPIPEWVKTAFKEDKSYILEVDKDGLIHAITISTSIYNDEITDIDNNHYYVDACIESCFCFINSGKHRMSMQRIVEISDMENFLGIKIEND